MDTILRSAEEVAAEDQLKRPPEAFAEWTGPDVTDDLIEKAEAALAVRLPKAYLDLIRVQNGGFLGDHLSIGGNDEYALDAIAGIGYRHGIDSDEAIGGLYMCREWGYPAGMVYLGGDGHTAVMLDYRECDPDGEPSVAWVDVEDEDDVLVETIAPSFEAFLKTIHPRQEDDSTF